MRAFRWFRRGGLLGLIALLTTALTLVGAEPAVAAETTFDISGVVSFKGEAQRGVKVWVNDGSLHTVTDPTGRYELHGVPEGASLYAGPTSANAPYLDTAWPSYPADSFFSGGTVNSFTSADPMDFDLWAALSGVVSTGSGQAVTAARICVEGTSTCGVSDRRGEFVVPTYVKRGGELTLLATARGYRSARVTTQQNEVSITLNKVKPAKVRACKPKLVGSKKVGTKLRVKCASSTSAVHFKYRWYRNGHRIAGAHGRTYRLTWADWRKNIKVKVVATKAGYRKTVRTSKGTGWIRWSRWHRS